MPNPVFNPPVQPSFDWIPEAAYPIERRTTLAGYDASRRTAVRKRRSATVTWKALTDGQIDYIESFFDQFNGATGPFDWTPITPVRSPSGQTPTLTEAASGSLAARTYSVAFTLGGAGDGETLEGAAGQINLSANNVLVVTIPVIPNGVREWRVYAVETPGNRTLQATISGSRTWQEPDTGLVVGADPPVTNTLRPLITWELGERFRPRKFTARLWSLTLVFHEQHT